MLLIHRLTPFAIGIIIAAVMIFTSFNPLSAPWTLPLLLVVVAVLCARLADFRWRDKDFWGLLITPAMLVVSAVLIFILADDGSVRLAIALTTALLMYFYEEHLFRFIHLPAAYRLWFAERQRRHQHHHRVLFNGQRLRHRKFIRPPRSSWRSFCLWRYSWSLAPLCGCPSAA